MSVSSTGAGGTVGPNATRGTLMQWVTLHAGRMST
jgi:hypothetical protein